MMLGLQHFVSEMHELQKVADGLEKGLNEQLLSGLSGSARTVASASLFRLTKKAN